MLISDQVDEWINNSGQHADIFNVGFDLGEIPAFQWTLSSLRRKETTKRPGHIPTAFDFPAMKLNMSSAVGSLLTMLYFNLCVADLIEYSGHCGEGVTGLDWHQPLSHKGPGHVFELFCLVEGIYLAILMRCCSVSLIGLINHLDNLSKQYL
ncbi:hypothetical protein OUZ56_022940 [Daphnia magna]|uniref:Uncharacterized protein n=1 Tax=Daphnia magna TaxID=35525 RepID=A0ABR0AXX8_9CRUS|nr:hypothetical protein OUZ56_022940 [Daphnia magna]